MAFKRTEQSRVIIPKLQSSETIGSYFKNFLIINRQADSRMSTRFFASKLSWPRALLTDVVNGRKHLSVKRAIEFCEFAGFSERQTQLFVFKAICENEDQSVVSYLNTFITRNFSTFVPETPPTEVENEIFSDSFSTAIIGLVQSRPGIKIHQIKALLDTFSEKDMGRLQSLIVLLEKNRLIELSADGIFPTSKQPVVIERKPDQVSTWTPKSYVDNLSRVIELGRPVSALVGATVVIPSDRFSEIREHLASVRDWLIALSSECREQQKIKGGEVKTIVVQSVLAAFSVHPVEKPK